MKQIRILAVLVALCFGGCLPQERFWWSPDGTRAVVAVGRDVYLAIPGAELKAPLSGLQFDNDLPQHVSWLPDGSGFLLLRVVTRSQWQEARALLPVEEAEEIERRAKGIPNLLNAAASTAGEADTIESLFSNIQIENPVMLSAAFFCAREKEWAAIEAAVLAAPKGADILAKLKEKPEPFRVHEICIVKLRNDQVEGEPQSIVRSMQALVLPKLSPKFPAVAYWRGFENQATVSLEVSTFDGKSRLQVAQSKSAMAEWTPDGRSLVFAGSVSDEDVMFQNIRKMEVLQESGSLVEKTETTDLAVAIVTNPFHMCALPDGRILFASQPATLPSTSKSFELSPRLFLISADGKSVDAVKTAPGDLPTNLSFFAASPDGKKVAVVESDTDAVAVVELATGKTEIVSPAHPNWRCRTMPAWKSATELTFAAVEAGKPKWMLWTQGKGVRSISDKWPVETTSSWLEEKKEQPKSGP
jgi:dipeptidyl aminopeptidase/acylaminoacyl peptidase